MIHVDRGSVSVPDGFESRAERARERLAERFRRKLKERSQSTPDFESEVWNNPGVAEALRTLFRGKCAFCESRLTRDELELTDHFRPKYNASQLDGRVDAEHYEWLAYEWDNMYADCDACSRAKGTRFPVEGRRAKRGEKGAALNRERRRLLDPCHDERPEESLDFREDGTVVGRDERGRATIECFGLNRLSLVEARRERCARIEAEGAEYLMGDDPRKWTVENFVRMMVALAVENEQEFVALTRQQARRYFERVSGAAPKSRSTKYRYQPDEGPTAYRGAIWLDRIEIENFRPVQHLDLKFPVPPTPKPAEVQEANRTGATSAPNEPWIMLLGENGAGKSSVLRAIALALMPEKRRNAIMSRPADWVTRGYGATSGMVRLSFTVGADPVELHFTRKSTKVTTKGAFPEVSVLGYGSTRLLPMPSASHRPRPQRIRVDNLFSSRAQLRDAERYIASGRAIKTKDFNLLATSLKTILSLEKEDNLSRRGQKLWVQLFHNLVTIRELSDGYQSVLAMALDMMLNLSRATFDMSGVEGLVLIDELEGHLHPRWKIKIVGALRELFPRVRFIATTHDPLCVQGLRPGELHVMARHPESKELRVEQIDVPPGTRADQILTGAWFGLPSTRDPQTVKLMVDHSKLLLRPSRSTEEETQLAEIEGVLKHRLEEYAGTSVQELGMQAAAEVLREGPAPDTGSSQVEIKAKILDRLREKTAARGR